MAGSKSPFGSKKKGSKLRDVIYRADPDELILKPNESLAVVPLHGVEDGFEFYQHPISFNFQGRWDKVNCNRESGDCPFCEDERESISRTVIRTVMLMLDPKAEKILFYPLHFSEVRQLMKWEDNLMDDSEEEKTETVRGKKVVFGREGSGLNTTYVANVYGDVTGKYSLEPYGEEIERVAEKVKRMFQPTDSATQREILQYAKFQFPKGKGGDETEEPTKAATVEDEDW